MPKPSLPSALLAAATLVFAVPALAQVAVSDPWVRGPVSGQQVTGAFMLLKSPADTALVAASSPSAKIVEIHEMVMDGGVMKMRAVDRLALPAGKVVELKPGGYHVMLMDLVQPLKDGETVPVTLTFEDKAGRKQVVEVKAQVKAPAAGGSGPAHKH
jgi:hypothetical protein